MINCLRLYTIKYKRELNFKLVIIFKITVTIVRTMKILINLLILCVASIHATSRIIGGKTAAEGKYPYQASLRIRDVGYDCGASIINKRWILTVAHCLVKYLEDLSLLQVYVGTNKLREGNPQIYNAEYIVFHKDFHFETITHDIGLVRVDKDIEFNDKVQPVKLPSTDFNEVGHVANLTGWGPTSINAHHLPNDLQELQTKIVDQRVCKHIWQEEKKFVITNSHICALAKFGQGGCKGDSGSPLVVDNVVIGIVSFGKPCALGVPDIFTRVYTFVDWIKDEIAKYENNNNHKEKSF